jgi:hypothetical protein
MSDDSLSRGARLLAEFLEQNAITMGRFGAGVGTGVSDVTVHRWVRGKDLPSVKNAQAIEVATKGAVRWTSFFTDDDKAPCPACEAAA